MSDRSNALTVGRSAPGLRGWRPGRLRGSRAPALRSARQGGDVGYAGNADQDGEAIGEALAGFDNLEDCGFDGCDLPIDRFEALSILTLQQRERQSFSAVPGGGAILHQGLTSDAKLLQLEQDLASGWARLQFQHCAHTSQQRRIQAIGLRQLASRLSET